MNSAIEIHDSCLTAMQKRGDLLVLSLKAYIHKSEGTPGVDAGTGWVQNVTLIFHNGVVEGEITEWPSDLYDGTLVMDGEASENTIPIPLDRTGIVELTLKPKFIDDPIVVSGNRVRLELRDTPSFVEEFPGS